MLIFLLKRLAQAIPLLLLVIICTFLLVHAAPGGPFTSERSVPPQVLAALNAQYNLDLPFWQQIGLYIGHLLQWDFGPSFKFPGRSVTEMISTGFPLSAELSLYALLFAVILGLPAGILAAYKANTGLDYGPMTVAMLGICLPSFVLGPLLTLSFGIGLGWLPVAGWGESSGDKILPAITLGASYAAYLARIMRGSLIEVLGQDFIRTARAKGVSEFAVLWRHALRPALPPVISFLGPAVAGLLAGSFVVETLFQIPGLGRFFIQAAFNRDYTMVLGTTIFYAALIFGCNILADLILVWLDPRQKLHD